MPWLPSSIRSPRRLLIAGLATVVVVVGLVAAAGQASSPPTLPAIAPARLIADAVRAAAADQPISGRLRAHADLGIPSIPGMDRVGSSGLLGFLSSLSGDHLLKVWRSADGLRLAELTDGSERDVVVGRTNAWLWDFGSMTAWHVGPFPVRAGDGLHQGLGLVDPEQLADGFLRAISPTTAVSVGQAQRIAGRAAYTLVLEPRTSATLVGSIRIALDAQRFVPLSVGVYPRGWVSPALSVAFTSVGFGSISASTFAFSPPPGAKVVELGKGAGDRGHQPPNGKDRASLEDLPIRTFGTGWATVVAVRTPPASRLGGPSDGVNLRSMLPFTGPLLSVRLVDRGDHGWLVFGAVPQRALAALEPELP
jgi:hypothetical protein